jgi:hypothetical protein
MRLLVFLHGTVLMHRWGGRGRSASPRSAFGGMDHLPDGLQDLPTFEP